MAQKVSKTTTDHETIRAWVEERGGWPAEVEATAGREGETGILRIDFPGYSGEDKLRRISWDDWFARFDQANLAFVYEDLTIAGQRSSFNELVARETAEARAEGQRTSRRGGGARTAARSAGAGRGKTAARGAAAKRGAKRATAKRGAGGRRRTTGAQAARTASRRGSPRRGGTRKSRRSRR